jgi:endonuclease G, mitochondrial
MGITKELLNTAQRFEKWSAIQSAQCQSSGPAERAMQASRIRFSGLQQLNVDPGVFLESVIEGDDLMPIRYFEMGKLAARPVGRIHFDLGPRIGQGYATGFLVAPGLLLTNHHVLPSAEVAAAATVTFDAEDGLDGLPLRPRVFQLQPYLGYLSHADLDFCFVAVAPRSTQGDDLSDMGYLRLHQSTGKIMRDEYATIIQHPRGRQKHVAARNNRIEVYVYDKELSSKQDVDDNNHLYYSTDTMPGSSGAPVFSDQWYVVALHRRGVPKTATQSTGAVVGPVVLRRDGSAAQEGDATESVEFIANEGVRISRIARCLETLRATGAPEVQTGAGQILAKIQATLTDKKAGPFWMPSAPVLHLSQPRKPQIPLDADLELTRRSMATFADAPGFDERFLGVRVRLPQLSKKLQLAAARRLDEPDNYLLPFQHFTTVMHAGRRLPIFAAVNIDGSNINTSKKPARPNWSYDPRIDEAQQPDDSIFSTLVQRGHMGAREFMWWGDDAQARESDIHSFTLTNVCPQIGSFNGRLEWYKLERLLMKSAKDRQQKVSCFMGPVFADADPLYDDLRSDNSDAALGTGIRMPLRFWYILVWKDSAKLKNRCFVLDQSDDIDQAGPLEFDFEAPATVREVTLAAITRLSKLSFADLK